MKIIFCSHNRHKLEEIAQALPAGIELLSLDDIGFHDEIEENATSFEGNALLKANAIYQRYGINCFADDSGLEVDALNGEPGVYSARYAGPQKNDEENLQLLLKNLSQESKRTARFRTVICLILDGKAHYFNGEVEGEIRYEKSGNMGFGYDPIFEAEKLGKTFAEMSLEEKNKYSHRSRALAKMMEFLT